MKNFKHFCVQILGVENNYEEEIEEESYEGISFVSKTEFVS